MCNLHDKKGFWITCTDFSKFEIFKFKKIQPPEWGEEGHQYFKRNMSQWFICSSVAFCRHQGCH